MGTGNYVFLRIKSCAIQLGSHRPEIPSSSRLLLNSFCKRPVCPPVYILCSLLLQFTRPDQWLICRSWKKLRDSHTQMLYWLQWLTAQASIVQLCSFICRSLAGLYRRRSKRVKSIYCSRDTGEVRIYIFLCRCCARRPLVSHGSVHTGPRSCTHIAKTHNLMNQL